MRRKDREIVDFNKMIEILDKCDCCHIGLTDNNDTYIVPLNFGYEVHDGMLTLYFHSALVGKKIDLIEKQKSASFEMDTKHELITGEIACDYSYLYQSIMGKGSIQIINNYDEKIYGLKRIMSHYSDKHDWKFDDKQVNAVSVIKLEVKEWSCKEH